MSEPAKRRFLAELDESPIALVPELANEQHYEVPPAFFEKVLGAFDRSIPVRRGRLRT